MSVILDALRRARGTASPRRAVAPPPPGIPAGLRVNRLPAPKPTRDRSRRGLLVGVVIVGVAVAAGVRFGPGLLRREITPRVATLTQAVETLTRNAPTPTPADATVTPPSGATATPTDPGAAAPVPATAPATPPATIETTADAAAAMIAAITQPSAIAPRAMPTARPAQPAAAAASPRTDVAGRNTGPAPGAARAPATRQPLPAAPSPAAATAIGAVAAVPTVNHFELAVRYHQLGQFEQALTHYTAAIQAEEFNVEAINNLGLLYHERGLAAEAITQFRRAIAINPQYLPARSHLAVVLLGAGRLPEARAELRSALAIDARNVDMLVNMALVEKADRQPEQAKEILIRALGYQPTHAAAHYNLAILYEEAGEIGRAYSHYGEFLKNAGPEYGTTLSDVRQRMDALSPRLQR